MKEKKGVKHHPQKIFVDNWETQHTFHRWVVMQHHLPTHGQHNLMKFHQQLRKHLLVHGVQWQRMRILKKRSLLCCMIKIRKSFDCVSWSRRSYEKLNWNSKIHGNHQKKKVELMKRLKIPSLRKKLNQ